MTPAFWGPAAIGQVWPEDAAKAKWWCTGQAGTSARDQSLNPPRNVLGLMSA
jgi:hypothetical protein